MRIIFPCSAALAMLLAPPLQAETVADAARAVEAHYGGRVGVMLRAPGGDPLAEWRADERFPVSSTVKVPLCGAVLARVDGGKKQMGQLLSYATRDLVEYSPVTEVYAGTGMTVADLCAAAITLSDNSAANFLLATLGGPEGFTGFLRVIGDWTTRLDRRETALNAGLPGDPRDTTTPAAITSTLATLLFSGVLSPASRTQLET